MSSASGSRSVMISTASPSGTVATDVDERAVDLAGERGLREARTDRGGDVEDGRALGDLLLAAVRQLDGDLGHGLDAPSPSRNRPAVGGAAQSVSRLTIGRLPYCLVLQYGQTPQLSLSALPHSMHGLRSFFMQYGQMRKSFSTGL